MTSVRESFQVNKKYVSHGGTTSGQSHLVNSTNNLENNLDALLEDLQTSVSRSVTPSGRRPISPQVEYRSAANPVKTITEIRSVSPTRTTISTTREKYLNPGSSGVGCSILGFEKLDSELKNVQPGQSKTVAYKQVSYQYNKSRDGKPIDSLATNDNIKTISTTPLSDNIHETNYEQIYKRKNAEKTSSTKTPTVNRDLVYGDTYLSSIGQSRDVKVNRETTAFSEPKTVSTIYNTASREQIQEYEVEQIPVSSSTPTIPLNLAPGPNTKVTTTIKTYTYELPGAPEHYLPAGHNGTDQTVTYKLDKTLERSTSPSKYTSTQDINKKSTIFHKESKYYQEDLCGSSNSRKPISLPSAPSPTNLETTTTNKESFYIKDERYENCYTPVDQTDYQEYQNQSPYEETTTTTLIDRIEEHYQDKPATPTRGYYTVLSPTSPLASSSVYKYSKESFNTGHKNDREILLPKPFPIGTQLYPVNGKGSNINQEPPAKLDDLMASFSDTERKMMVDSQREDSIKRQNRENIGEIQKKTVDFVSHSPPKVQSKNLAGPPVYYPPGSAEFKSKEEEAMMQASGEWAKARGQYEYEASSKTKQKQTSGKAVVPVCLPLCCALPCVIM